MDWSDATLWWLAAGLLVALELATGTFYLLMLAVGAVAAALAAHAALGTTTQLVIAAVAGGGAVFIWHLLRRGSPAPLPAGANRDVNLDIGERVQVPAWQPDGSTSITYRGAQWSARYAGDGAPQPGEHVIRGFDGNRLLLGR